MEKKQITVKELRKFPEPYRTMAASMIRHQSREAVRITADSLIMGAMIVLIEEFGFGTTANATKLRIFHEKLQAVVDTSAEYYDDAVAEGLKNRLYRLGVEYAMR